MSRKPQKNKIYDLFWTTHLRESQYVQYELMMNIVLGIYRRIDKKETDMPLVKWFLLYSHSLLQIVLLYLLVTKNIVA